MAQLSSLHSWFGIRIARPVSAFAAFAVLLGALALTAAHAQTNSHLTGVDPGMGKVNDSVTASGEGLAKGTISAVYLSDDKNDYKATIVQQQADKIVFKVPEVKAGDYNISIQIGQNLLIQPVRFTVQ